MKNRKFYTCCFTGHRPSGLPWGYNEKCQTFFEFRTKLKKVIEGAIQFGCDYFICGMALGFDTICAEIVLELKSKYRQVKIEVALPCKNQAERWREKDIKRYQTILTLVDRIFYLGEKYTPTCMNERNRYMVEKSEIVIALWNGKPSGTYNTIKYAQSLNKKIKLLRI